MSADPDVPPPTAAEEAINRVLHAEQVARLAIAECEQVAQQGVAQARRDARAIEERADHRIAQLHARCASQIERANRTASTPLPPTGSADGERAALLESAIARLAARLTGGEPGEGQESL